MDFEFASDIKEGSVPKKYIPGVVKGIESVLGAGVVAGYPVLGMRASLVDGAYHDVYSSVMAFEIAGWAAAREGSRQSRAHVSFAAARLTPTPHLPPLSPALGIDRVPARDRAGPSSRTRTAGARRRERCLIRRGSDSDGSSPERRGTGESTAEARRAASGREPLEDELRRRGLSSGIGAPEPRGESLTLSLEGMQSELLG